MASLCLAVLLVLATLCVLAYAAPSISSTTSFFQRTDLKVEKRAPKKRLCAACAEDDTNYRQSRKQHKNNKKISSTVKPTYMSMYQQHPERERFRSKGPCLEGQRKDVLGYCRDVWGT